MSLQNVVEEPDLFDVHGASPSPHSPASNTVAASNQTQTANITPLPTSTPSTDNINKLSESSGEQTLIPNATSIIRSISDNIPLLKPITVQPTHPTDIRKVHVRSNAELESPVSSNASSPMPPNMKHLGKANTLDKFSKQDLFKLFGKARKENRSIKQEVESLRSKNKDIFKALSASNEQNEVLKNTNQHVRDEYNALQSKISNRKRENEEKLSLVKTQCASYMDEVNRLNEQMVELKTENDVLQSASTSVESKIGEQYTQFTVQITSLQTQLEDSTKENQLLDTKTRELSDEIAIYREQIGGYKDIARKAEVSLDRIQSLEEELRDKIRENHQLQIKTRSLNQTIKRITDKSDKQNEKIEQLESEEIETRQALDALKKDHASTKEHNQLLNEKLNILLKENADHTVKTEKKIERIEDFHLAKYKTLLNSFQMMKKRIEANNRMNEMEDMNGTNHSKSQSMSTIGRSNSVGYSNAGWKGSHDDHYQRFNFEKEDRKSASHLTYCIDLEMDEEAYVDNVKDLNRNISQLTSHSASYDSDSMARSQSSKQLRAYQKRMKEYKHMIRVLSDQLKQSKEKDANNGSKKRSKVKHINVDYLRNVLVKFLILSEYLTDEQVVLVPVLGSILNLSRTEKDMIDNSYNNNRYFMGANTLFPETANAKYSPQKRKKRKKKRKELSAPPTMTKY